MASGTIPVQSGSVVDITPLTVTGSRYYDVALKYVNGVVFLGARIDITTAEDPYSEYFIPAQYAPSMPVALSVAWAAGDNRNVGVFAVVAGADSSGNRRIRVVSGAPSYTPGMLAIFGSWPVA